MWEALRDAIHTHHPHARIEAHGMRFVLELEGQRVGLYVLHTSTNLLAILADIGTIDSLDPVQALVWNASLTNEAIAIFDGILVVRTFVDPSLAIAEIESRIQSTARIGAMIKAGKIRSQQPSVFAHFAQ